MEGSLRKRPKICDKCAPACACKEVFRKILELQDSGLVVYICDETYEKAQKKQGYENNLENAYIFHNNNKKDLKESDYVQEFTKYKTYCYRCHYYLQEIRCLLDDIKDLKGNEVLAICEHCKRTNFAGKCKRCYQVVNKYLSNKIIDYELRQQQYNKFLKKLGHIIKTIAGDEISKDGTNLQSDSAKPSELKSSEIEKLVSKLKQPLLTDSDQEEFEKLLSELERLLLLHMSKIELKAINSAEKTEGRTLLEELKKSLRVPEMGTGSKFHSESERPPLIRFSKTDTKKIISSKNRAEEEKFAFQKDILSDVSSVSLPPDSLLKLLSRKNIREKTYSKGPKDNTETTKGETEKESWETEERKRRKTKLESVKEKASKKIDSATSDEQLGESLQHKTIADKLESLSIEEKGKPSYPSKEISNIKKKMTTEKNETIMEKAESDALPSKDEKKGKSFKLNKNKDDKESMQHEAIIDKLEPISIEEKGKTWKPHKEFPFDLSVNKKMSTIMQDDKEKSDALPSESKKKGNLTKKLKKKGKVKGQPDNEDELNKPDIPRKDKESSQKLKQSESFTLLKLLKAKRKEVEQHRLARQQKIKLPIIADLPIPKERKKRTIIVDEAPSENSIQCKNAGPYYATEMIKGTDVVPIDLGYNRGKNNKKPLFYKVRAVCPPPVEPPPTPISKSSENIRAVISRFFNLENTSGIFKYKLSSKEFIENGYTVLPTLKVMRKINVYKMVPADPENDWFLRNRHRHVMFYETGEILAEIGNDRHGRWYYKSGKVALDFYKAKEVYAENRYVIYSSGENDNFGNLRPITVLASFDHIGNGVVYDHNGNTRIKYNQTAGEVLDEKIGPLSQWKWHALNDPPDFYNLCVNKFAPCTDKAFEEMVTYYKDLEACDQSSIASDRSDKSSDKMLVTELENLIRDKDKKTHLKYKPFNIKMKALKINEQFSLRIIDQAKIFLFFRDGPVFLKLNLGMHLMNNEILDCESAEASGVSTPFDRVPARSDSVGNIKRILEFTRKNSKKRNSRLP